MAEHTEPELISYLEGFVTDQRRTRMREVLEGRTRYITVVVEDIYQPHNASAVLRTCDCFGIQDVHIIENRNSYQVNPGVELGTAQWLTLHRYRGDADNTARAVASLRESGYRIVATTPHTDQRTPDDLDLDAGPIALLFGTELDGLSDTAFTLSDEHLVIPMYGFVESFNISVSAAIILSDLSKRLRSSGIRYGLSDAEKQSIYLSWLRRSVGRAEALEREFRARSASEE